jgi:16S rRNA A1518/A1519 N6-dimethyltransferase RsmA/KsgA/DIM1 with predicted DNA glycosylase/AP lyase activity
VAQTAAATLRKVFSRTTANGLLHKGGMFVVSTAHARQLLQRPEGHGLPAGALLDVGAGDGGVTEKLVSLFQQTVVTETSSSMVMRLKRSRKYTAVVGSGTRNSSSPA